MLYEELENVLFFYIDAKNTGKGSLIAKALPTLDGPREVKVELTAQSQSEVDD
jgi:hypothetical protein